MEKTLVSKQGYYLKAVTWENDGDNYKTKEVYFGDDEKTARMVADVISNVIHEYGNEDEDLYEQANSDIGKYLFNQEKYRLFAVHNPNAVNIINDYLSDLGFGAEYYCYRVCDELTLIYNPAPVYMETETLIC